MPKKKILQWTCAFSVLSLYTLFCVYNLMGYGTEREIAKAIAASPTLSAEHTFIVVDPEQPGDQFTRLFLKEKQLCGLNIDQLETLKQRYDVQAKTIKVNGADASVVTINGKEMGIDELQQMLSAGGSDQSHCTLMNVYQQLILLQGGHLS